MTISEAATWGKSQLQRIPMGVWVLAIIILSSSASFGLGLLAGREAGQGGGVTIEQIPLSGGPGSQSASALRAVQSVKTASQEAAGKPADTLPSTAPAAIPAGGQYVASKSGTKYYLPWCGTVSRIKEENKVWFASKAEAEAAGYQPAANCKGI